MTTVEGVVRHVIFRSGDGSFSVVEVQTDAGERVAVVGRLAGMATGERWRAEGEWEEHERFGRQLRVSEATRVAGAGPGQLGLGANVGPAFDEQCTVRRVIYASADRGYAVVAATHAGGSVVLAGPIAHLEAGDRIQARGTWTEHAKYGKQVKVEVAEVLDPDEEADVVAYLAELPHVGPRRARALADLHGDQLFAVLDEDPYRAIAALPRMPAKQASRAAAAWEERRASRGLHLLLAPHGLARLVEPLREKYGPGAVAQVRRNPYALTELHGVGFPTADRLAQALAVDPQAPGRAHAAILHVLAESEQDGHAYLPINELARRSQDLIGPIEETRLHELAERKAVVVETTADQTAVYRAPSHAREVRVADALRGLAAERATIKTPHEAKGDTPLTDEQRAAVALAFEHPISVITGGPGTGKTTLTRRLVQTAVANDLVVRLCAPTGRAARRLEEATGKPAQTIHRLLEWVPGEGPTRNAEDPVKADLLVVDESSMLDLVMIDHLLAAVDAGTHVVLVGDADQLPPVGVGRPFADIIESGAVPVTRLGRVFRQGERSAIVTAAHAVNAGRVPDEDLGADFEIRGERDAERAVVEIVRLVDLRAAQAGVDPVDGVQVLAPGYRGPLGIDRLNEVLRERFNPEERTEKAGAWRVGDKLIQTRNDYEIELMNGEVVRVRSYDAKRRELLVTTQDGRRLAIPEANTETLRLAYAVSVHKAQGCEVPVVIVTLHRAHHRLLTRNLLYTAITRARRDCVVVADPLVVRNAVARADAGRRWTRLVDRLRG